MSKYKVGDVVFAPVSYFNRELGYYMSQERRWVIVNIRDEPEDEIQNITVSCTGKLHQANIYDGIIVKHRSPEGSDMSLTMDTFIYCDRTYEFSDEDITRRIGFCPIVNEIQKKLGL